MWLHTSVVERQEEDHRSFENCQRQMQFLRLAQRFSAYTCFTRLYFPRRPAKNWAGLVGASLGQV